MKNVLFFFVFCVIIYLNGSFLAKEKDGIIVKRCIDGDTIVLEDDTRVRILGIDTFDKSKKQLKKQMKLTSFSKERILELQKEGTGFCIEHLEGKKVNLIKENKKDLDRYQRKLRYIEINNQDYGEMILKANKAMVYCSDKSLSKFKYYNSISNWKCF